VFGPAGAAIGAGWGAAVGYIDGASRELSEQFLWVDYPPAVMPLDLPE
jgi:hypothetical protein